MAAAERVFDVLDAESEYDRDRGTRQVTTLNSNLEFDRVTFAYEQTPVLDNVSFVAQARRRRRDRRRERGGEDHARRPDSTFL